MRKKVKSAKDRAIFKRTVTKTRDINVAPKISRGGIRL